MKNKKRIILIILVVIGLGLLIRYLTLPKVRSLQAKEVKFEDRVVTKTVSASGTIKSQKTANLAFPSTQVITQINVKEGDKVTRGQALAYLEYTSSYLTVQYAKDARDIVLRKRELFEADKETNKNTLGGEEEYNIRLRQYNEEVSQAEASYQAESAKLNNFYISAPFEGTVVDITKQVGETAAANETIIKLSDLKDLYFEVVVDQEDFGAIKLDQAVEISLDAYGNKKYNGKVTGLQMFANENSDFVVDITFTENGSFTPSLGMTGDAKIIVESTTGPVKSLFYDEIFYDEEDRPFVWVVNNNYIAKEPIEIGLEGDIYTEVLSQIDKTVVVGLNQDVELSEGFKAVVNSN